MSNPQNTPALKGVGSGPSSANDRNPPAQHRPDNEPHSGAVAWVHPKSEEDRIERAQLARIAEGDKTAMRALYDRRADTIHRFARLHLSDQFEVADIVHETMLGAWRNAGSFQGRSSVRSWLLRMARNKVIDHIRKQSRVTLAEPDETVPGGEPDAETVIAAAQDADRVRACVNRLPAGQRAVIQLAFFEDLTYAEVAAIEGIPEGTVKTRIYHAKMLLARYLSLG